MYFGLEEWCRRKVCANHNLRKRCQSLCPDESEQVHKGTSEEGTVFLVVLLVSSVNERQEDGHR